METKFIFLHTPRSSRGFCENNWKEKIENSNLLFKGQSSMWYMSVEHVRNDCSQMRRFALNLSLISSIQTCLRIYFQRQHCTLIEPHFHYIFVFGFHFKNRQDLLRKSLLTLILLLNCLFFSDIFNIKSIMDF